MRVRRRLQRLPEASAVAIGNFDGFHAGHRRIIETLVTTARSQNLGAVVLSFHPHPRVFFGQDIRLISTDAQRLEALKRQELDRLFFIDFAAVAGRPAAEFVRRDLLGTLRLRVLVVGDDFRFGRGREGDLGALERQAAAEGFSLIRVPAVESGGARVTSSRIRKLLESGDMRAAAGLLERPYFIDGVVERGAGRGRRLGFPTMNIASANDILPEGVFRTELEFRGPVGAGRYGPPVPGDRDVGAKKAPPAVGAGRDGPVGAGRYGGRRLAATFIGHAPAFTDPRRPRRVETHVPGFHGLAYGRGIRLHFLDKIREVRTFADPAALAAQIARDVAALGI